MVAKGRGLLFDTEAKRRALPPRKAPYWLILTRGRVSLGFWKGATSSSWKARIGTAEFVIGDGDELTFDEARSRVLKLAEGENGGCKPATVAAALDAYIAARRTTRDARRMATHGQYVAAVPPSIRSRPIADVDTLTWSRWASGLVCADRSARTANRYISAVKTAMRESGTGGGWEKLKKFDERDQVRLVAWTAEEARRVMAEADRYDAALGRLVRGAILTGFRFQALQTMRARDVLGAGVIHIEHDKTGSRDALVSPAAYRFLADLSQGRDNNALLFTMKNSEPWTNSGYRYPLTKVFERAGVDPASVLYSARHTFVTLALYNNVPLHVIAASIGTSAEMISKHYAKVLLQMQGSAFAKLDAALAESVAPTAEQAQEEPAAAGDEVAEAA